MGTTIGCLLVVGVVILIVILSSAASNRRTTPPPISRYQNTQSSLQTATRPIVPRVPTPPTITTARPVSPTPTRQSSFVVKDVRPGFSQESISTTFVPPISGDEIDIPRTVTIYRNQTLCKICGSNIRRGLRNEGWARCLETQKLVHGQCYSFVKADRSRNRANWCAVCEDVCGSGRPMSIEGRTP